MSFHSHKIIYLLLIPLICILFGFSPVQIEELGSEGRVEEAQGMMKLVEQLKEERELLSSTPSVSQGTPSFLSLFFCKLYC